MDFSCKNRLSVSIPNMLDQVGFGHFSARCRCSLFVDVCLRGDGLLSIPNDVFTMLLVVIAAADKYELLARNSLGEPSKATSAVSGGTLYLRSESRLYATPAWSPAGVGENG